MKTNETTALALADSTMKPKPTRAETVAAMVEIARENHAIEREATKKLIEALDKKRRRHALSRVRKELASVLADCSVGESYKGPGFLKVSIILPSDSVSIELESERQRLWDSIGRFDAAETKRQIMHGLAISRDSRVSQILADPESKKLLTEVMKSFS